MAPLGGSMAFPTSPVHENLFHRKAAAALDFLVVGGSIAGLAAAYNLRQAGHRVRVLEKGDGKYDVSEGSPLFLLKAVGSLVFLILILTMMMAMMAAIMMTVVMVINDELVG